MCILDAVASPRFHRVMRSFTIDTSGRPPTPTTTSWLCLTRRLPPALALLRLPRTDHPAQHLIQPSTSTRCTGQRQSHIEAQTETERRETERQLYRHAQDAQTETDTETDTDTVTDRQAQTNRQTNRQTKTETGKREDRERQRQRHEQTPTPSRSRHPRHGSPRLLRWFFALHVL
mmetsp:Transcript_11396/g.26539  ORF Transcript_11396/g.26539 Transcript_11396/m.26539 type:complete len:175 (-) Transcript_11396:936-1460(-)